MRMGRMGIIWGLLFSISGQAQNYHAIEGSPFAGSLGVANNPASILMTPYPWDITVMSLQLKTATNAVTFHNLSLLSPGGTSQYSFDGGNKKRYTDFNFNLHLLNIRLALSKKVALAGGINIRGYGAIRTGVANYNDTLQDMNQFFDINNGTTYSAYGVSSSWIEGFLTYSRTLWDNEVSRLNGGITLKVTRGISGAFAQLNNATVQRTVSGTQTNYLLNAGDARYGYSSNYDYWFNGRTAMDNMKSFVSKTRNGAALDLGAEYIIKPQAVKTFYSGDDYYDYEWKIGVSLLDIGWNNYVFGSQSRTASSPKSNVSDSALDVKFGNPGSLAQFNDSLATIVNNAGSIRGTFKVWNPTRLVINIDRSLPDNFAVNANLSLNLAGSNTKKGAKTFFVKEMNLLNLTPRWETKRWGVYLPLQVTTDGKFWIGGAVKAGPLLLGVHNWTNVFLKNKIQNGGFYLALMIRPGQGFADKADKKYDCPKY